MDIVEENASSYSNPVLNNYECEGQLDIFDVFSDNVAEKSIVKTDNKICANNSGDYYEF